MDGGSLRICIHGYIARQVKRSFIGWKRFWEVKRIEDSGNLELSTENTAFLNKVLKKKGIQMRLQINIKNFWNA